jgi:hypothetical protein
MVQRRLVLAIAGGQPTRDPADHRQATLEGARDATPEVLVALVAPALFELGGMRRLGLLLVRALRGRR